MYDKNNPGHLDKFQKLVSDSKNAKTKIYIAIHITLPTNLLNVGVVLTLCFS